MHLPAEEDTPMEACVGTVTHYYRRICVAVLTLQHALCYNDCVRFAGHTTDFTQKVWSMEVNHQKIHLAGPGAEVALKVVHPVRRGDRVFLIPEQALESVEM
jgi:putative protease